MDLCPQFLAQNSQILVISQVIKSIRSILWFHIWSLTLGSDTEFSDPLGLLDGSRVFCSNEVTLAESPMASSRRTKS